MRAKRISGLAALALVLALGAAGCSGGSDQAATPAAGTATPTAAASPAVTPGGTMPATASVEPSLQPVIDAVVARDWQRISALLVRRNEPCITEVRIDTTAPPCPAGSPAGTPVAVFPAATCHPFVFEEELREQFERKPEGGPVRQLYGIFRPGATHPRVERLPTGTFGLIFSEGPAGMLVMVRDGQIVSADFGCATPPADFAARVPPDAWVVAPPRQGG